MITSAFSAGNSFLFCSSRILYGLALRKQAPSIFTRCTEKGLPIVAVLCSVRMDDYLCDLITSADGGT
jgi:amino acid transporter